MLRRCALGAFRLPRRSPRLWRNVPSAPDEPRRFRQASGSAERGGGRVRAGRHPARQPGAEQGVGDSVAIRVVSPGASEDLSGDDRAVGGERGDRPGHRHRALAAARRTGAGWRRHVLGQARGASSHCRQRPSPRQDRSREGPLEKSDRSGHRSGRVRFSRCPGSRRPHRPGGTQDLRAGRASAPSVVCAGEADRQERLRNDRAIVREEGAGYRRADRVYRPG